jgi:hypothetical protein
MGGGKEPAPEKASHNRAIGIRPESTYGTYEKYDTGKNV